MVPLLLFGDIVLLNASGADCPSGFSDCSTTTLQDIAFAALWLLMLAFVGGLIYSLSQVFGGRGSNR
jgi:hypothetical protein